MFGLGRAMPPGAADEVAGRGVVRLEPAASVCIESYSLSAAALVRPSWLAVPSNAFLVSVALLASVSRYWFRRVLHRLLGLALGEIEAVHCEVDELVLGADALGGEHVEVLHGELAP